METLKEYIKTLLEESTMTAEDLIDLLDKLTTVRDTLPRQSAARRDYSYARSRAKQQLTALEKKDSQQEDKLFKLKGAENDAPTVPDDLIDPKDVKNNKIKNDK